MTDQATLSGANASSAGGTVTYRVFSLSFNSFRFSHFGSSWLGWSWNPMSDAGHVAVTDGSVPPSNPVTLRAGVYFWKVSYSGDSLNQSSRTEVGSQTEIVLPQSYCSSGSRWWSMRCFMNSHSPSQGNSGTDNSGTDNSGTDNSGTDNSGTDNSGTDNSGTDNSGTDNSGTGNSRTGKSRTDNGRSYGNGNGNGNWNGSNQAKNW